MLPNTDPRSVERHEPTRADERTAPVGGPASVPTFPAQTEHAEQVSQSTAGVVKRERVVTDESGIEHRDRTVRDVGAEHSLKLFKVAQLVWLVVGTIEGLIGLRIILKLIGANPANEFASFIYNAAGVFLAPFFGLVGSPSSGDMVLEIPSLIAILVYGGLGWLAVQVILPLFTRTSTSSTSTYDRYKS